jgi:hypothetical protein
MMSPYQYAWGDPVSLTDPDGRCPLCLVAAVSAGFEYGSQVYSNYQSGHTGYDAWVGEVDFVDVAVEGGLGFIPGGKLVSAAKIVGGEFVKSGLDVSLNEGMSYVGDGTEGKDVLSVLESTATNSALSAAGGELNGQVAKAFGDDALKQSGSALTAARKKSTKADNVAGNGGQSAHRNYGGLSSGQARNQYSAAAKKVQNVNVGRSFGANNGPVRQFYEETFKKAIGAPVNSVLASDNH